jgi:hypothetical protein
MLNGTLVPPPTVFLKVVDILMAADGRTQYHPRRELRRGRIASTPTDTARS